MNHWHGIVKVQRSIEPVGLVLIYDERQRILIQRDMPPELERMFFPGELKFYADATFDRGTLKINARNNKGHDW